jgi:hypothetical protein
MEGMQGMIRCGLLAGSLIACHTSAQGTPDGAGPDGDGSAGAAGLHVAFTSDPTPFPAQIEDGFTLELAVFKFDNLKVIGDAGPGDPRTTATGFQVKWDSQSSPAPIDFSDAPTGLYSKVSFQIDGHLIDDSYLLKGHVTVNGTSYPFEIDDRNALSLSLDCSRMLAAGGTDTIAVKFAFHDALQSVDWTTARMDDGQLELSTTDAQMAAFRAALTAGISIDNSAQN